MINRARDERLQIMLSQDELQAIDDFRFHFRLPSRAAAIRELLKRGLASEEASLPSAGARSRDFGVIDTPRNGAGDKRTG